MKRPAFMLSVIVAVTLTLASTTTAIAGPSATRIQAMDILYRAYSRLHPDNNPDGVSVIALEFAKIGIERALALDPEFAYANIVRAEVATMEEDWQTAVVFYEKGIKLTSQPDQIYSPDPSIEITVKEVKSHAQLFLAYAYFELARGAFIKEDMVSGLTSLAMARMNLELCLTTDPDPVTKKMAEELLGLLPKD